MAEPVAKPAAGTTLQSGIAEALAESQYKPDEPDLESQLASFDEELAAEDEGEDEGDVGETDPSKVESQEASEPAEGDAPFTKEELATAKATDSYWGTDLTGIPVERKAALIRHLSQQDGTIRQLQAKLAEPLEAPAPTDDVVEEATDEQLLAVLGLDPESVEGQERVALVTLARNQLALEDQVSQLTAGEKTRAAQTAWNGQLDELEATYGKLPGTREEVLRYAIREQAVTPADLYFKLTAPIKQEVGNVAAAARREAAKRVESGGTLRPRSSSAEAPGVTKGMSMRDAVKAAAMEAQKETGLSWKQAVKRVLTKQPGAE